MKKRFARYPSLNGKGILVTGGATGIGQAIAHCFAEQSARVGILDINIPAGNRFVEKLGPEHRFIECDVTDTYALKSAIDSIATDWGRLDVLIANAADDTRHTVEDLSPALWEKSLSLNLGHQFFAAQAAEPHIRATGGGTIICMGSTSWLNNTTGMVAYSTAKAGIHGLVRTLARLWGKSRIRVNALLPGWTMTQKQLETWVDKNAELEIEANQCLPGRVMPEDVARMALFLASDDAAMITHQAFIVDGGWI